MAERVVIALLVIGGALLIIWALKRRETGRLSAGRTKIPLAHLHSGMSSGSQIPKILFFELFQQVGKCYGVDPQLLRPTDRLDDLSAMDSWVLGAGEEELLEWLAKRGVADVTGDSSIEAILLRLKSEAMAD